MKQYRKKPVVVEAVVFNQAQNPPFSLEDDIKTDEEIRLNHRYLDLRRTPLQRTLRLRHEINRTVRRSQSIIGSYGARTRQDLPEVVRMAAAGQIRYRDIVTRHFSLDQVAEGYDLLRHGQIQGRGVVDMSL